jgi:uncharacterized protein
MAQYLYRITPTRPAMLTEGLNDHERAAYERHAAFLEHLTTEGTIILVGRTQNRDPSTFGICIFNAASDEAARAVMAADPFVSEGVMHAELFPYRIAHFAPENVREE